MHADDDRTVEEDKHRTCTLADVAAGRDCSCAPGQGHRMEPPGPKKYRRALPPIMQPWHARPKPAAPERQADGGEQG